MLPGIVPIFKNTFLNVLKIKMVIFNETNGSKMIYTNMYKMILNKWWRKLQLEYWFCFYYAFILEDWSFKQYSRGLKSLPEILNQQRQMFYASMQYRSLLGLYDAEYSQGQTGGAHGPPGCI